ncbi:MAG: 23S rRNA (adenine(2503)-C(2))-methyltransferase RlmN [Oscillospiraceae bacterium]|jgi:23S rRNA (adenine2503-C2)-methyltransferase|nr:23S rRNA (adenine(2503)-C(2))-methyltransferase RlmN [Oscillospiraceae bacterium]
MLADIKSMTPTELRAEMLLLGEREFHAGQIFAWLTRGARDFDEMTDLSRALREKLKTRYYLAPPEPERRRESRLDGTIKYLWRLRDGERVESVVMSYRHGNTICVSSQAGCRMGCAFCASALGGLSRNLTPSELLDQVIFSEKDCGKKISNIVLMGIGEPLDNYDNVLRFLELASHADGMNIGMRHISLSTCGLTEKVDKLGDLGLQLTLSVSLHAPDDLTRTRLMPVNKTGGVAALMASCRRYFEKTGRRISFEYALIDGVNDTIRHARELCRLLRGAPWHLNLILLNNVAERELRPSSKESVAAFTKILTDGHVNFTFRRRLGADIDAACGQLRRSRILSAPSERSGQG